MRNLAAITQKLVDLPYELGEKDCFSIIVMYLKLRGYQVPEQFCGFTMQTYKAYYESVPWHAKQLMCYFFDCLMDPIAPHKAFAGDVLLLELPDSDSQPFAAIDGGNATIVAASPKRGVAVTPIRYYTIRRAWRCRKLSR